MLYLPLPLLTKEGKKGCPLRVSTGERFLIFLLGIPPSLKELWWDSSLQRKGIKADFTHVKYYLKDV